MSVLTDEQWQTLNAARLALIDRKYSGGLSADEEASLARLQAAAADFLDTLYPLPWQALHELRRTVMALVSTPPLDAVRHLIDYLRGQDPHRPDELADDALQVASYTCYLALGPGHPPLIGDGGATPATTEGQVAVLEAALLVEGGAFPWLIALQIAWEIIRRLLEKRPR